MRAKTWRRKEALKNVREKKKKGNGCRNVAVPVETYEMLANMKAKSGQTIKHLLNQAIRKAYFFTPIKTFSSHKKDTGKT